MAIVKSAEAAGNLEQALGAVAQERLKQERVNCKDPCRSSIPNFLPRRLDVGYILFNLRNATIRGRRARFRRSA